MSRAGAGARGADRLLPAAGLAGVLGGVAVLGALLAHVAADAFAAGARPWPPGLARALAGSASMVGLAGCLAVPIGIGAAVYLEEYAPRDRLTRLIELNIASLAGVPAVVYGLLGLAVFVRALGLGRSLAAGAATLALIVLPAVILSTRAALRAVPPSLRDASRALGATRWQTLRYQVLPAALPGTLAGLALALARALGEAAPLIMLGALGSLPAPVAGSDGAVPALPVLIFDWLSRPEAEFLRSAAVAIMVLLVFVLLLSGLVAWMRDRWRVAGSW